MTTHNVGHTKLRSKEAHQILLQYILKRRHINNLRDGGLPLSYDLEREWREAYQVIQDAFHKLNRLEHLTIDISEKEQEMTIESQKTIDKSNYFIVETKMRDARGRKKLMQVKVQRKKTPLKISPVTPSE